MSEVPKFVRQRLAQQAAGEHPDANLLTAFAENALTGRERAQVLEHLGACAACREVVSVALPEVPAAAPVAVPAGNQWSRWPTLRWAGVAAAVVVVAAAVVVQNSRRAESTAQFMRTEPVAKLAETKPAETSGPSSPAAEVMKNGAEKKSRDEREPERAKTETRADKKKDTGTGTLANANAAPTLQENRVAQKGNEVAQNNEPARSQQQAESNAFGQRQAQQNYANVHGNAVGGVVAMEQNQQPAAPPPSSANESVGVTADAATSQVQNSQVRSNRRSELDNLNTDRAKSETKARGSAQTRMQASAAAPVAPTAGAAPQPMMRAAMVRSPKWRLSAGGTLERSTDSGSTWHLVEVAAQPLKLRSFSVVGGEIWAGGTGGALYRSGDGGRTWKRIEVKAGDVALESDIVRVEFLDAQSGALKTASGQTWTTNDAGATWSVRP